MSLDFSMVSLCHRRLLHCALNLLIHVGSWGYIIVLVEVPLFAAKLHIYMLSLLRICISLPSNSRMGCPCLFTDCKSCRRMMVSKALDSWSCSRKGLMWVHWSISCDGNVMIQIQPAQFEWNESPLKGYARRTSIQPLPSTSCRFSSLRMVLNSTMTSSSTGWNARGVSQVSVVSC